MDVFARSPQQVGTTLRKIRRSQNLTQMALGERAGLRQATVSNIENGDEATRLATLCDVLAALDLELVIRPRSKSASQSIGDIF